MGWKCGRNNKWKASARNGEGNKFNQFKFCTNSHLGFLFDFKSNYCFVCRYDTLVETCTNSHTHAPMIKYPDLRTLLFFFSVLIQKFHFNPTGGFVSNTREKKNTAKQKQNHLNQFADWLHAIRINWTDDSQLRKFSRWNFYCESQFKWESMSKINQFESWECVRECVHEMCIAKNHSKMMNKFVRWLNFYDTSK